MTLSVMGFEVSTAIEYGDGTDSKPTLLVDTYQSIKKPMQFTRYGQHLPDDAIKLAYAAIEALDADENIILTDRSQSILSNSPEYIASDLTINGDSFSSYYRTFLLTDVTTTAVPTQPVVPLFYKHELPSTVTVASVFILDKNFQKISTYLYTVVAEPEYDEDGDETGNTDVVVVYNNLVNSFDEDTGESEIYYVQYVDPANDNVTETVLLSNERIYREATFDDINWSTFKVKEWVKAYTINQSLNTYDITLPVDGTYYVQYEDTIRLHVLHPIVDEKQYPWFVRLTNGSFMTSYLSTNYTYRVPEFRTQQFNPVEPYKLAANELATVIGNGLVQVRHSPTAIATLAIDITIQDRDGSWLYALTTNSLKDNTTHTSDGAETGLVWDSSKILGYDDLSGIIQLDLILKDYYTILATYYYTEEYYEYTLLNLNPISNDDAEDYLYVVYAVPEIGAEAREESIYHLKVGKDGLVKECSQADIAGLVVGRPYGRPDSSEVFTTDNAVGFSVVAISQFEHSFIRNFTVEGPEDSLGYTWYRYLVLAELSVVRQTSIADVTILDDRQRGGGIKEELVTEAKQLNPEVAWYGDIGLGGGLPYPGRLAMVVRLPHGLLTDYNGRFELENIKAIVKRHTAFGSYPIVDFYGIIPTIAFGETNLSGTLIVEWPTLGSDCTYDIYYSNGSNAFQQHNSTPIADDALGNTYTFTGLTAGIPYYFYVVATADDPCGHNNKIAADGLPAADGDGSGAWGDGWDRHAGPRSKTISAIPFGVVAQEDTESVGLELTVTIV